MPTTITRIQKTRLGRFSLYGEEGFLFSLDSETYFSCGVEEGDTLTDNDLAALREKSDARKAKDKALQYLSLRLYGERELYDKLCLKFDGPTSAAAVAEMVRLELLEPKLHPVITQYEARYEDIRVYLYKDYTDELGAAHGNFQLSREYIEQVLNASIDPAFLTLE